MANDNNNNDTNKQLIEVLQEIRQSLARTAPAEGEGAPRLTRDEQQAQISFLTTEQAHP